MIIDLVTFQSWKDDDISELVIAGFSESDLSNNFGEPNPFTDKGPQITLAFRDGYMRVFTPYEEVVTNFESKVWFVGQIDNEPTGGYVNINHTQPRTQYFLSTGAVQSSPDSDYINTITTYRNQAFSQLKKLILDMAELNGIIIKKEYKENLDIAQVFYLLCYPLINTYYEEGASFQEFRRLAAFTPRAIMNQHGGYAQVDEGMDGEMLEIGFLRKKTLKEATIHCLRGKYSKVIHKNIRAVFNHTHRIRIEKNLKSTIIQSKIDEWVSHGFTPPDRDGIMSRRGYNVHALLYIRFLSSFLSVDHIQTIFKLGKEKKSKIPEINVTMFESKIYQSNLFKSYTEQRLVKLFSEEFTVGHVRDACRQYDGYLDPKKIPKTLKEVYPNGIPLPKKPKTWKEIHDRISKIYNEIKAEEKNIPFDYTEDEFKIHFATKDGYMIKLPSSGKDVVKWGQKFKHCIASYIDRHDKKEIMLLGIYEGDELMYNAEFKKEGKTPLAILDPENRKYADEAENLKWNLYQCRGLDNKDAPAACKTAINSLVKETLNLVVL